jgi:phenylacetate-coenzyme A ligase PaaK-like adenylate-forming protein
MKNNNFLPFFILVIIVTLSSCSQKGTIVLNHLQNDTTIVVPLKWITKDPIGVILNIKGHSDDTCKMEGYLLLKGEIDTTFSKETYDSEKFWITYKKYKSKNTSLTIEYSIPGF